MKTPRHTLRVLQVMLASTLVVGAQNARVPDNNKDAFVTKPAPGQTTIDLGATIEVDEKGYPTPESFDTLYDEMDFQRAVNAYLQTMPQMALYGSVKTNHYYGATENTDSLVMHKDPSIDGMLTPNRVVTYLFNYPNLDETGPMVYEYPGGETAGIILDIQMRWAADLGLTSPFGARPTKYLVLPEWQQLPEGINREKKEYEIVRVKTSQIFFAFRVLNPVKTPGLEKGLKVYPYAERDNPKPNKFYQAKKGDKTYHMTQPVGMKYWERLHELIQIERTNEADRFMMNHLQGLGIEKGKPFNPDARQKRILEKAALVGEKMAIMSSFAARSQAAKYRDDSNWVHPLTLNPSHRDGEGYQFEQRVDWTFEAYGISTAMKAGLPGKGSTYLAAYRDHSGKWLEGEKSYVFRIAPDAPAARFWDISVYRTETRGLLPFEEGKVSAINNATTKGLKYEEDGSILIYFGPGEAPKGYENNFIHTLPGVRWFTYFRLYGPTEKYFDRSWPMQNIKEVK